ncbi:MAG: hypothetical protein MJ063_08835, partial [Lachnospiraceae bacterium]|nr:hypothetical protein [Lachnospiraceae bacterium]
QVKSTLSFSGVEFSFASEAFVKSAFVTQKMHNRYLFNPRKYAIIRGKAEKGPFWHVFQKKRGRKSPKQHKIETNCNYSESCVFIRIPLCFMLMKHRSANRSVVLSVDKKKLISFCHVKSYVLNSYTKSKS